MMYATSEAEIAAYEDWCDTLPDEGETTRDDEWMSRWGA